MNITILGRPISKKNSKRVVNVRGRVMVLSSKAFESFRIDALKQLTLRGKVEPPYAVTYEFQMKGRLDSDIDNMIAGINDILQEKGILTDDKEIVSIAATKKAGHKDWKTIISIFHIDC